jgi:hypothetical protein
MPPETVPEKPLPLQMVDLIIGYWVSQLIYVAARLDLADRLKQGPMKVDDLAKQVDVDQRALYRMMRALASVGVFAETDSGVFSLTALAETLRSDRPDSMRDFALMMVEGYNWKAWQDLHESVKGDEIAFDRVHGMPIFEYFEKHPEHREVFARSMSSISGTENPAVAESCDFSKIGTLVEVGGSQGHLLATILRLHPGMKGVLFDRPSVIEQAMQAPFLKADELDGRVTFEGGDFFEAVPSGGDGYLMKYILHDWNDEQCATILSRCREAMNPDGRVFVVDTLLESGNEPQLGKLMDINMLVLTGGRERTEAEFAELFGKSGLRLEAVHPTECPLSVVEAVRA